MRKLPKIMAGSEKELRDARIWRLRTYPANKSTKQIWDEFRAYLRTPNGLAYLEATRDAIERSIRSN